MTATWPETDSTTALFAALHGSEGLIGLLYLGRNAASVPFDEQEIASVQRFASHVGMPLQRARYQENLAAMAFRDPMTELSNYRYFEQRLFDELSRAKRYQQPVTVIIVDIDYFKQFNDNFGHKAGDAVLKQFGQILKSCLRDSDLPARYGGEEFIVICPKTNSTVARYIAERIRAAVEACLFNLGESLLGEMAVARITASVGTATYPDHATLPADIVRQADRSLYAAKKKGRNLSVGFDDISLIEFEENEYTIA